jgi:hypothetical protein
MPTEPLQLEIEGYPCHCGHKMAAHDIGVADYSQVIESAEELRCMMPHCDCADYTIGASGITENTPK